jgi:hypothetical protein
MSISQYVFVVVCRPLKEDEDMKIEVCATRTSAEELTKALTDDEHWAWCVQRQIRH